MIVLKYQVTFNEGQYELLAEVKPGSEEQAFHRHGRRYPTLRSLRSRLEALPPGDEIYFDTTAIPMAELPEIKTAFTKRLRAKAVAAQPAS